MKGARNWTATAVSLAVALLSEHALAADPDVLQRYSGATLGGAIGTGPTLIGTTTLSGDIFSGIRMSRWVSFEGVFAYQFGLGPWREPGGGGMCTGASTDTWHWESFGGRVWINTLHARRIDISLAPSLSFGFASDRIDTPGSFCYAPSAVVHGWAFDGGIDLGVEVRATPWFGIRATIGTFVDVALAGSASGFFTLSATARIGPVLRY